MRRAPVVLLLILAACGDDETVTRYQVPKPPPEPVAGRLLGAIFARPEQTWFFKVAGDPARIEAPFLTLVASVSFEGGNPQWTLPPGWRTEAGSGMRFATIVAADGTEISVTVLDGDGGGLLANVNRWRGQVGLAPIGETELPTCTRAVGDAVVVDLVEEEPPDLRTAFRQAVRYDVPEGWIENANPSGERIFEFAAGDAFVTVTAFPGSTGGVAANINRWRGQVGLAPEADPQAETILFLKTEGHYVKLDGPEQSIRVAFVLRDEFTIFFKMMGPAATVAAQTEAFEAWLTSLRPADE